MPTFRHGKNTVFKLATAGSPTVVVDISNSLRSVGFPRESDTAETTAFGSTVKTWVVGIPGATFTIEGMFDATVDAQLSALLGFETPVAWQYGPEGSNTGRVRYSQAGSTVGALMTGYDIAGAVADMVAGNCEFVVSGAITRDTWP